MSTNQLIKYEAARRAIAECRTVDEVKSWADKAAAMQAYQRMAGDKSLEIDAAEIRIRAERRLGEMLAQSDLQRGGRPSKTGSQSEPVSAPKLSDVGISKKLSSRAQKLAAVPEEEFEAEMGEWRDRVQQEGKRVTTRLEQSGERHQKTKLRRVLDAKPSDIPDMSAADELDGLRQTIAELAAENDRLRDGATIAEIDGVEEKDRAAKLISELRKRVQELEAELLAVKSQRDQYMNESAQKQRQITYWRQHAEKAA